MIPDLYLKSLQIRNIATFDNQIIEFDSSFNAIVGETGSGKSLILDSLQLVFGGRADKKIVRKGCDYAMVEAIFHAGSKEICNWLHESGHPLEANEIVVKRLVYPTGPSKAWLNFQACPVSLLTQFSRRYIDLVGQFENQKLLSPNYLLKLLDQFAGHQSDVTTFSNDYINWLKTLDQLNESKAQLSQLIQQEDFVRFQLSEIEELNPSIEDEKQLIQKKTVALNQERHQKVLARSVARLSGDEDESIINQLNLLIKELEAFPLAGEATLESLRGAQSLLSEADYTLGSIELEPVGDDELDNILERLDKYQKLKRKFGGDIESVMTAYSKLQESQTDLDGLQKNITRLEVQSKKQQSNLNDIAKKLHTSRLVAAKKLSKELTQAVKMLNMSGATLVIEAIESELNSAGSTQLRFNAETNAGEGFFPVANVASGGELSRILLSLRQVLSSKDSISVFLFDEIDAGIGGETALKIGKSLQSVSKHSQVIAITHLPQIAVHANQLVHVSKEIIGDSDLRTLSKVEMIEANQHRNFIESMTPLN